jgi:hypothetical protein
MKKPRIIFTLCMAALLSACLQTPAKPHQAAVYAGYESLLEDAERIFAMPPEAQQKELAALAESRANRDNHTKRAMLYTLIHSSSCNAAKPASAGAAPGVVDETARDKWERERKALTRQLKDSVDENAKLAQKARDEQTRADSLQQKLDELKNIEKSMVNREQGTRR